MADYADRIKPTDLGITTYLEALRALSYQIPTFQREVVWSEDHVKKLWDSVFRFYPLGSILIWKTELRLQKHRSVGGHVVSSDEPLKEYQYILDGQQRTTALLTSVYGGQIEGRGGFDPTLYVDLTVEVGDEPDDDLYKRRFLFWSEIDDRGASPHPNNARKRRFDEGLVVRLYDVKQRFGDIERVLAEGEHKDYTDPVRKRLRESREILDNYRVALIELKGIQVAEVCQIFDRINRAGKPLDIFDIVVAKTFVPEGSDKPPFYLRDLIEELRASVPTSRFLQEVGDHTLLQMVASIVRVWLPEAGVHNVTDLYLSKLTAEQLQTVWPGATKAIRATFDFFDNHLRLSGPALVPYRYLYLAFATYLYENPSPDHGLLARAFWYYGFHSDDILTNTGHLGHLVSALVRARSDEPWTPGPCVVDREKLRGAEYSMRGRVSRSVLALYANHEPLDWGTPTKRVIADVYYSLTDKPNLHHVFPRNHLKRFRHHERFGGESLMNIAYLTQITNLQISDKNPVDYVGKQKAFSGDATTASKVLQSHLMPENLVEWSQKGVLPANALGEFVEARIDLVIDVLREKLGSIGVSVVDSGRPLVPMSSAVSPATLS